MDVFNDLGTGFELLRGQHLEPQSYFGHSDDGTCQGVDQLYWIRRQAYTVSVKLYRSTKSSFHRRRDVSS